jgi:Activator of Hsp90 ATPase homolog 1-like protein
VIEPEKLVWTEPEFGITSTSTFTDLGDGRTEVHIHQSDLPEQFATPEAREGFNSSLDRFAAYLATL